MNTRTRDPLTTLAAILAIAAGILMLTYLRSHAAVGPASTPALTTGADAAWEMFRANGPWWGGFFVVLVALQTFLSRQHWLAQGRVLATLTGLAMVGAAIGNWHFAGAPSAGIMTAAVTAIALVWRPTVAEAPAAKPGGGAASMLAVLLLGALAAPALTGCTATKARQAVGAGVVAALDCEASHLDAQTLADARTFAEAKVMQWLAGTLAPDSARIKADLAPIKSDLGRCAIAGALAAATALLPAPTPGTAISALSSATAPPAAVRAQFEIGARLAGWPPVQLPGGEVM